MAVPTFKSCFCCSLKTGTVLCASIYMLLSLVVICIFSPSIVLHMMYGADVDNSTLFSFSLIILIQFSQFCAGIVLIVATYMESPDWMCPWIWVSFTQSAGLVITAAVTSIVYIIQVKSGEILDDNEEAATYFAFAVYGIVLYFAASVVNSYKNELYAAETAAPGNKIEAELAPLSPV